MFEYTEHNIQLLFTAQQNLLTRFIIPNYTPISWFECDLFVLTQNKWFEEIEIKISKSDFINDSKKMKPNGKTKYNILSNRELILQYINRPNRIYVPNKFWYLIPEPLIDEIIPCLPSFAGLISIKCYIKKKNIETLIRVVKSAPLLHSMLPDSDLINTSKNAIYRKFWNDKIKQFTEKIHKGIK